MKNKGLLEVQLQKLEFENRILRKAFEVAGLDFFDINLDTGEAKQSSIIGRSMGYEEEELNTLEKRHKIFYPDDLLRNLEAIDLLTTGVKKDIRVQSRLYEKNGGTFWMEFTGSIMIDDLTGDKHFIGMLRDITQEKLNIDRLRYIADYDSLTNAYSRRSGLMKLDLDMNAQQSVTIVYIDLDGFKIINDNLGHHIGDNVIKSFGNLVMKQLPEGSYLVRLGGDEFLCVLVNRLKIFAKEMIANIVSHPVTYGLEFEDELRFSYGIATYDPLKHSDIDELIKEADERMYIYKKEVNR